MKIIEAFKISALGTLDGMHCRKMWEDIGGGMLASFVLLVRCLILVTFPISVPLIAVLIMLDERKRARDSIEARARMRRGMHNNGR